LEYAVSVVARIHALGSDSTDTDLRDLGHRVQEAGEGERILPAAS
jgi:hypothetical protein